MTTKVTKIPLDKAIISSKMSVAEYKALIIKASSDRTAAKKVIQMARENGTIRELVAIYSITENVERSLVNLYAGKDELFKEVCAEKLVLLSENLAGDNPTGLEKLLCDRIAFCWFHLQYCETIVAQNTGDMTLDQAEFHQRKVDRAHKRYLSAIKALAQVRKLQLPNVQLNIAEKQVNIGQATPGKRKMPDKFGRRLAGAGVEES